MAHKWRVFNELRGSRSADGKVTYENTGVLQSWGISELLRGHAVVDTLFSTRWVGKASVRGIIAAVMCPSAAALLIGAGVLWSGGLGSFFVVPAWENWSQRIWLGFQVAAAIGLVAFVAGLANPLQIMVNWVDGKVHRPKLAENGSLLVGQFANFGVALVCAFALTFPIALFFFYSYGVLRTGLQFLKIASESSGLPDLFAFGASYPLAASPILALAACSQIIGFQRKHPVATAWCFGMALLFAVFMGAVIDNSSVARGMASHLGLYSTEAALLLSLASISTGILLAVGIGFIIYESMPFIGVSWIFLVVAGIDWLLVRSSGVWFTKVSLSASVAYLVALLLSGIAWKLRFARVYRAYDEQHFI